MATPATTPTTPATAPVPAPPAVSTAPEMTPQPTQQGQPSQQELSIPDLLFALTCYCYIFASKLGYEAINSLNQNLVVVLDNYSEVSADQGNETTASAGMFEEMRADNNQAKELAKAATGTEIPTPHDEEE